MIEAFLWGLGIGTALLHRNDIGQNQVDALNNIAAEIRRER